MGTCLSKGTDRDKTKRGELLGTLESKGNNKITIFFFASFEGPQAVLACPSHRGTFERGGVSGSKTGKVLEWGLFMTRRDKLSPGFNEYDRN
jgi:hypothetical protein